MMTSKIVPILDAIPHKRYCEIFGGGASVLFAKKPVEWETYNDLDSELYNFFSVLADPELFERFRRRVEALPHSREIFLRYRKTRANETDKVKRAAKWFVMARQSFSGALTSGWRFSVRETRRGMAMACSDWLSTLSRLPEIHDRLIRVQIEHNDWRRILDIYDTPDTLFYLDPPYVPETRKAGGYKHELSVEDHRDLIAQIQTLQGNVAISGYRNETYAELERAGWCLHTWDTACSAAGKTRATKIQGKGSALRLQPRTECLWVKPYKAGQKKLFEDIG